MKDLVILKTNLKGFKTLQVNIRFYKALGVDFVEISPFESFGEKEIGEVFVLNEFYKKMDLVLFYLLISRFLWQVFWGKILQG